MKIRHRLTLQFTLLTGIILLVIFALVYLLSARYVSATFYRQLEVRALITAQVYLEKDELAKKKFLEIQTQYLQSIPGESSNMYDEENKPVFIENTSVTWPAALLEVVRHRKMYRFTYKGQPGVGLYYNDNQGDFVIIVTAMNIAGNQQLVHMLWILGGTFILGLLMIFLIGQWYASRSLQPIQHINQEMKKIRATSLHLRVQGGKNEDELRELAGNFNELLERLEKAFVMQQSFVSNASHELRTPLTAIITELEVILQKERNQDDYVKTLRSVLDESGKLKTITNGLLELTKADEGEYAKRNLIRLDELLWDIREEWQERHPEEQLEVQLIDMPEDAAQLEMNGNRELLELAIKNIIRNAFKFSDQQPVICRLECYPGKLVLSVTDTGIGIATEDFDRIFLPLFRADNAHRYEGFGIGLPMAQKIIQAHNGRISLQSTPGVGSTFNVSFTTTV
jgi:signal transduction histidine kinase